MIATDFCYDGVFLSDFGFVICQFDDGGGFVTSSAGSQITFSRISQNCGRNNIIVSAKYEEQLTTDISICKPDGSEITTAEFSTLMRWLNRTDDHELRITMFNYYTGRSPYNYDDIHFMGTFNVDKVEFRGKIVGMTLHFISDGPFGYGEPMEFNFTMQAGNTYLIVDSSEEVGYIYPDELTIKCNSSGTLTINNSIEGKTMRVNNMRSGETLTFDGTVSSISSDSPLHTTLMDDFNYTFLRIANTYDDRNNVLTSSLPCTVRLVYTPRKKVVF